MHHWDEGHAGTTDRVGGAELLQPAVVGAGPAEGLAGIGYLAGGQAGTEGRRLLTGHRIAVSEDDLPGHPVGVQHRVTHLGVVGTLQAPLVVALPFGDELGVQLFGDLAMLVAFGYVDVELLVQR